MNPKFVFLIIKSGLIMSNHAAIEVTVSNHVA